MPPLRLDLNPGVVVVNTDKITPDQMDDLSDQLAEVSRKHSIFGKYPMEEGETIEAWKERVEKEIPEKNRRKDEESVDEYMKRIFKPQQDKKLMLFDTLSAISHTFGGSVSYEGFRKAPYGDSKNFVLKVLKGMDFPVVEYE